MATIGDVLRALLRGDRLSPENLQELERAVSDFETQLLQLRVKSAQSAPAAMHVPIRVDAEGFVIQEQ